jgi:hypothetical protein
MGERVICLQQELRHCGKFVFECEYVEGPSKLVNGI